MQVLKGRYPALCLFVACFRTHQHLGHIGPTLGVYKEYIRRGIAIIRLLRHAGLGRGNILQTRCHTGSTTAQYSFTDRVLCTTRHATKFREVTMKNDEVIHKNSYFPCYHSLNFLIKLRGVDFSMMGRVIALSTCVMRLCNPN
jgi:hypothetical protein